MELVSKYSEDLQDDPGGLTKYEDKGFFPSTDEFFDSSLTGRGFLQAPQAPILASSPIVQNYQPPLHQPGDAELDELLSDLLQSQPGQRLDRADLLGQLWENTESAGWPLSSQTGLAAHQSPYSFLGQNQTDRFHPKLAPNFTLHSPALQQRNNTAEAMMAENPGLMEDQDEIDSRDLIYPELHQFTHAGDIGIPVSSASAAETATEEIHQFSKEHSVEVIEKSVIAEAAGKRGGAQTSAPLPPGPERVRSGWRTRSRRCSVCPQCQADDCGRCICCLDKPKFGGPNKKKSSCLNRKCENLSGGPLALKNDFKILSPIDLNTLELENIPFDVMGHMDALPQDVSKSNSKRKRPELPKEKSKRIKTIVSELERIEETSKTAIVESLNDFHSLTPALKFDHCYAKDVPYFDNLIEHAETETEFEAVELIDIEVPNNNTYTPCASQDKVVKEEEVNILKDGLVCNETLSLNNSVSDDNDNFVDNLVMKEKKEIGLFASSVTAVQGNRSPVRNSERSLSIEVTEFEETDTDSTVNSSGYEFEPVDQSDQLLEENDHEVVFVVKGHRVNKFKTS